MVGLFFIRILWLKLLRNCFQRRDPRPMAEFFPIIFGPFDFRRARANLRACNGASYQWEGIPERQLVRPLLVSVDGVTVLNFKTGISET